MAEVITGGGFFEANIGSTASPVYSQPTVTFTSTVNGTQLDTVTADTATVGTQGDPSTTLDATVLMKNAVTGLPATPGTYTVTVTNPDGGSYTSSALFTVTGNDITAVSPSSIGGTIGSYPITIYGNGFQSGASVTVAPDATAVGVCPANTVTDVYVASANEITATVNTSAATTSPAACDVTVTNGGSGDNSAVYVANDALGVDGPGELAPVITSSNLTSATALEAGAPITSITFTGEGFSQYTAPVLDTYIGTSSTTDGFATMPAGECIGGSTGTTVTCELDIASGATAGAHTASLENDPGVAASTGSLADAFTVAGPTITSVSPTSLSVGAPIGTTVTVTGTGFTNTSQLSVTPLTNVGGVTGDNGVLRIASSYVSATSMTFTVITSPNSYDNGDPLTVSTTDSDSGAEVSAPFDLSVGAAPTVTSITYATNTTGVGVGATAQTITINGSGFATGATVGCS